MRINIKFCFTSLLVTVLFSCNDRQEGDLLIGSDRVAIDSVKIVQDSMDVQTIQSIKTFSNYSKNCEGFYGYDYIYKDEMMREVTAYNFKTDAACAELVTRVSVINFRPQQVGNYTFKFWKGKDSNGADVWIEKSIVVQ